MRGKAALSRAVTGGYELTDAGRKAWQARDKAIPQSFRLVLWLIDFYGEDYLSDLTRRYSTSSLPGLLGELEDLKLVKRRSAAAAPKGLAANDANKTLAFSAEEQRRFEHELRSASNSLLKGKAYVSESRPTRPLKKAPSETVVLIVEDDPDQLALADLRVSTAGYTVWVAESAAALQETLVLKGPPDILLLDVMLPDGDGFDILRRLRRHAVYAALPIILLTAKTQPEDIAAGLRFGADGYITKPYSKAVLHGLLRQILGP
jgi:CheY-like chemotaxis protein